MHSRSFEICISRDLTVDFENVYRARVNPQSSALPGVYYPRSPPMAIFRGLSEAALLFSEGFILISHEHFSISWHLIYSWPLRALCFRYRMFTSCRFVSLRITATHLALLYESMRYGLHHGLWESLLHRSKKHKAPIRLGLLIDLSRTRITEYED